MSDKIIIRCEHCNQPIVWDEVFHWIHGDMSGGWNTSCEDDEHRAEPNGDEWMDMSPVSIDDFLAKERVYAEEDKRRQSLFEELIANDLDTENAGSPDHQHKFIPDETQPPNRFNLQCSCGIRMEGPANG